MAKYLPVKITKMYRGMADARCYIVEACSRSGQGIVFDWEGDKRWVHHEEIDTGVITARGISPKFPLPNGMKTFSLISWKWNKLAKSENDRMNEIKQMTFFTDS